MVINKKSIIYFFFIALIVAVFAAKPLPTEARVDTDGWIKFDTKSGGLTLGDFDREGRIQYYTLSSGGRDPSYTALPANTTFSPSKSLGSQYSCDYYRKSGEANKASCAKSVISNCGNGTKDAGEACDKGSNNGACPKTCSTSCTVNTCSPATPPAGGDDGGDDGGTATTPSQPVEFGFSKMVDLDNELTSTKGCGTDGKYANGILKGVSCSGATKTKEELVQIVKNIIEDFLLPIVGVLFITVLVVGGLVYITSGGNEESLKRAKKILTSGIIGFLIVVLSYTLIKIFVTILGGNIV